MQERQGAQEGTMTNTHAKHLTLIPYIPFFAFATFLTALFFPPAAHAVKPSPEPQWGSYLTPFAADSLWNARPVGPVFGTYTIPTSSYFPTAASGAYSTGVFLSKEGDPAMQIDGVPGKTGVWDPDTETMHQITLPHWPADVTPAQGTDGHADIIDSTTGIIHSFWQLRFRDGHWTAAQYAWTRLDGRGWGDPAHYFQGARAAAVPPLAGILRKHEVNDGEPYYHHVLAMSLTFNALAANPAYVFPATSADADASANSGQIPEGALLMLPPSYDTAHIAHPAVRKIAETLKRYGAYVVDRNHGTPFVLYVENGATFNLHEGGWNNAVANELQLIRAGLRQVVSTEGWVDGNGQNFTPQKNLNLLSMRGTWNGPGAPASGQYDSWTQSVVFPATNKRVVLKNIRETAFNHVSWAAPAPGANCRLQVIATKGAKLRLLVHLGDSAALLFDSGELADKHGKVLLCPGADDRLELQAISGVGQPSSVRAELTVTKD
jgi:hypothetical protein